MVPRRAWQRYSCGDGAKGPRYYDWAPTSPRPVPLQTLVTVAGRRWTVEENFQAGKGLTGPDQHQVRRWT
jgi:SRSO17 transposase